MSLLKKSSKLVVRGGKLQVVVGTASSCACCGVCGGMNNANLSGTTASGVTAIPTGTIDTGSLCGFSNCSDFSKNRSMAFSSASQTNPSGVATCTLIYNVSNGVVGILAELTLTKKASAWTLTGSGCSVSVAANQWGFKLRVRVHDDGSCSVFNTIYGLASLSWDGTTLTASGGSSCGERGAGGHCTVVASGSFSIP